MVTDNNWYGKKKLFKKHIDIDIRVESSPEPPDQKACHYKLRQQDSLISYATIFHLVTDISVQYWFPLLSVRDAWVIIRMFRHPKLPSGLDTNPFRVILLNHIKDFVQICYCIKIMSWKISTILYRLKKIMIIYFQRNCV